MGHDEEVAHGAPDPDAAPRGEALGGEGACADDLSAHRSAAKTQGLWLLEKIGLSSISY